MFELVWNVRRQRTVVKYVLELMISISISGKHVYWRSRALNFYSAIYTNVLPVLPSRFPSIEQIFISICLNHAPSIE